MALLLYNSISDFTIINIKHTHNKLTVELCYSNNAYTSFYSRRPTRVVFKSYPYSPQVKMPLHPNQLQRNLLLHPPLLPRPPPHPLLPQQSLK